MGHPLQEYTYVIVFHYMWGGGKVTAESMKVDAFDEIDARATFRDITRSYRNKIAGILEVKCMGEVGHFDPLMMGE